MATEFVSIAACGSILIFIVAASLGVCFIANRLKIHRDLERIQKEDADYLDRLINPKFEEVEEHFGKELPDFLKQFFQDKRQVLRSDFLVGVADDLGVHISHFRPCDQRSISEMSEAYQIDPRFMPIASDGGDLEYFVDPSGEDPPLMQFDAEDNTWKELASCRAFLAAILRV